MKAMNTAIIMCEDDLASGALATLLPLLQAWSTSISLVLLAENMPPQTLSLPVGLAQVLWLDRRTIRGDIASQAASLAQPLVEFSHLLIVEGHGVRPLAARLAAQRSCSLVADVVQILSPNSCRHPVYAGQALLTVQSLGKSHVWTLRHQAFNSVSGNGDMQRYSITSCSVVSAARAFVAVAEPPALTERPSLARAEIVVGGGRGVRAQQWNVLAGIADKLGAALGGTRALVDSGLFTEQHQIGQTGEHIAPHIYLACGISGAIQHVAGVTNSNVIIAINNDPNAPIIKYYADYYLLGDLAEVLPSLWARI